MTRAWVADVFESGTQIDGVVASDGNSRACRNFPREKGRGFRLEASQVGTQMEGADRAGSSFLPLGSEVAT